MVTNSTAEMLLMDDISIFSSLTLTSVAMPKNHTDDWESSRWETETLYTALHQLVHASCPQELLEAVSDYARKRGALSGHLFYFDQYQPEWIEVVAEWAYSVGHQLQNGWRSNISHRSLGQHWLAHPRTPTLISDITVSEIIDEDSRAILSFYNVRGLVALPLNNKGCWVGVVYFSWDTPVDFSERDERIFTALQQQAAPVIDSMRLSEETQRRSIELEQANQEINLLYLASEAINKANTYAEVVEAVSQFDPDANEVTLMLWENLDWDTAEYLEVIVVLDRAGSGKIQSGARLPKEGFPIAKHMLGERVWLFEDALTDPRIDPITAESWAMLDIRSFMGPALYIGNRWIGGITFHSAQPRHYTQRQVRLFAGIGDLAVAAVERIRLQKETEAARQAAELFADQVKQMATMEERNRLARELHDSVSQVLYSISLWGHSARAFMKHDPSRISESIDYILSLAEVGLSEMRALIFELRPESLEEEGLITALCKQVTTLRSRHGIHVDTHFCDEPQISLQAKSELYRIAREALHNAIKHAQASHIMASLLDLESGYHLEISDNGIGFDTSQSFPGHLGLKSMQERTAALKGLFHIESAIGAGTRIRLTLPQ